VTMSNGTVHPDAISIGVPAGAILTPRKGDLVTTAGAVISGLNITGTVFININARVII